MILDFFRIPSIALININLYFNNAKSLNDIQSYIQSFFIKKKNNYERQKLKILLFGLVSILFICFISALFGLFCYLFILKTQFAKSIDFRFQCSLFNIDFEFPFIKKNFILILLICAFQGAISRLARDFFEKYKDKYKEVLVSQGSIKKEKKKTESQLNKDRFIALCITFIFVFFRNFIREFIEILQFILNKSNIGLFLFFPIVILFLIEKYSTRYENSKINKLLNRCSNTPKKRGIIIPLIPFIKKNIKFLNNSHFDRIITVIFSTLLSLGFAKLFFNMKIMQNIKFSIFLNNQNLFFLNNENFLLTNVFFSFFFAQIAIRFLIENVECNKGEKYNSLQFNNKNKIRNFFISFINSILFTVGIAVTIETEKFFRKIDKIEKNIDLFKIVSVLTIAYFLIISSYTILPTISEIYDKKKEFKLGYSEQNLTQEENAL
jgi:hypothetical protein